ncbi:MAG: hypothetical protein V4544_05375 [Pseudomonadota bacterium]
MGLKMMFCFKKYFLFLVFLLTQTALFSSEAENKEDFIFPVPVKVELLVLKLDDISNLLEGFSGIIQLKTVWKDPNLAFDKKEKGVSRIMLDDVEAVKKLESIWNPNLKIKNILKTPQKQHHGLIIYSDGKVEYILTITGEFGTPLDTKAFPFDEQLLVLDVESTKNTMADMRIVYEVEEEYDSGITIGASTPLWYLHGFHTKMKILRGWNGYLYENLRFMVKAERASATYVPMIFFPFFMIMLFPLILLWVSNINIMAKISVVLSSLLALITLQFTITLKYSDSAVVDSLVLKVFGIGYMFQLTILFFVCILEKYIVTTVYSNSILRTLVSYCQWALPLFAIFILAGYIIDAMK